MNENEKPGDDNVVNFEEAKRRLDAQGGRRDGAEEAAGRASPADEIVALATSASTYFTDDGEPYAAVTIDGHREVVRLRSPDFRVWLEFAYFRKFGSVPKPARRRDAMAVLEGLARFEGRAQRVHVRLGEHENVLYLDLGNARREVVAIDDDGWRVVADAPIRFRRPKGLRPIPRPERGGSIDELRPFLNLDADAFPLVVGWLVGVLRPIGPYPILAIQGEQGSGKSTLSRVARRLIDSVKAPLRSMPRSERDLAVSTMGSWILAYDNLSGTTRGVGLAPAISDALCRVSTGGGIGARKLYTDADETVLEFSRPVIINGIDDLAVRGDLAERALVIAPAALRPGARRDEATFWAAFDEVAPRVLGALLDGVASARSNYASVRVPSLPRMADFTRWVTAAEPGLGWPAGTFVRAYETHRERVDSDAMDRDPVARLMAKLPALRDGLEWTGTAAALFRELVALADGPPRQAEGWPAAPNALSAHLGRLAPILRANGYVVTMRRTAMARTISVTRQPSRSSSSSRPSERE